MRGGKSLQSGRAMTGFRENFPQGDTEIAFDHRLSIDSIN